MFSVFASEFGSSVYSSFESMSPTLAKEHWSVHGGAAPDTCHGGFQSKCEGGNTMSQRNVRRPPICYCAIQFQILRCGLKRKSKRKSKRKRSRK